jgi:signal transduction histidine kinase
MALVPKRILVIDDCSEDRELIRRFLSEPGDHFFEVLESEDGVGGWECVKQHDPDCVLLDYSLPDFDGTDFLRNLGQENGVYAPPIIVLTGGGSEAIAVEAMKHGAQDYFVKGQYTQLQLLHAIDNAIDRVKHLRHVENHRQELIRSHFQLQQLTTILAVDLKSSFQSIQESAVSLETQAHSSLPSHFQETLDQIGNLSKDMQRLVDDLVFFIDLGKEQNSPTFVSLESLIEEVQGVLQPQIQIQGAQIAIESLPSVQGYVIPLKQLFFHLIDNSLRHSGEGGVVVKVSAERSGSSWHCMVWDNGPGMSFEKLSQVFSLFGQENIQMDRLASGLGMAICQRIVMLHGGRIWVESAEAHGTVVHFTLPDMA